ncbi:MAG: FMN-binding negative transcriptional regulator [Gammaproteobacteria bacterium]|jgi:transcriptional regulator|nr:FMN-binding negative transcriptional regulator [Gammaproteobacteria bacterium]MDH5171680.1 FMN-binding negative transcriptional regulator [Gammaproteobacteria bacterium]
MYIPRHFAVTDRLEIVSFLEANAFGQLISTVDGKPFCSHLPFLVSGDGSRLIAHVARQNPQHNEIGGQLVLATFAGPHDYVSPSWYSAPGVPTWNYQAVHVYGQCSTFSDPVRLGELVETLADRYESGFARPWQASYESRMLEAIVGIDIAVTEIQCKYKLGQNRPEQDQRQVAAKLREAGSTLLADAMDRSRSLRG